LSDHGLVIAYVAMFAATATAIALAWRDREHRPIAALLLLNLFASAARTALRPLVGAQPVGGAILLFSEALFLAGPFSLAVAALCVLARRPWWCDLWIFGLVLSQVVLFQEELSAERIARVYLAAELGALLVCAAAFARSCADLRRPTHLALAMIVVVEMIGVVLGPWRYGIWARWDLAQVEQVALYGVLTILQGGELAFGRRP
jgi:hypothetical protein